MKYLKAIPVSIIVSFTFLFILNSCRKEIIKENSNCIIVFTQYPYKGVYSFSSGCKMIERDTSFNIEGNVLFVNPDSMQLMHVYNNKSDTIAAIRLDTNHHFDYFYPNRHAYGELRGDSIYYYLSISHCTSGANCDTWTDSVSYILQINK